MVERGGKRKTDSTTIAPNFLNQLDFASPIDGYGCEFRSYEKSAIIELLNRVSSYESAKEALKRNPLLGVLYYNATNGDYAVCTRTSKKEGWRLTKLTVRNSDHLREIMQVRGTKFAGMVVSLMKPLNKEVSSVISQVSDEMAQYMVPGNRFSVLLERSKPEDVPSYFSKTQKKVFEATTPNHGSLFYGKDPWYDREIGYRVYESESFKPDGSSQLKKVTGEMWEAREKSVKSGSEMPWFDKSKKPLEEADHGPYVIYDDPEYTLVQGNNSTLEIDFSQSFEADLDIECNTCGLSHLRASYRDGSVDVQVVCGCGYHQTVGKSKFLDRYCSHIKGVAGF